jgi:hypothetical protein
MLQTKHTQILTESTVSEMLHDSYVLHCTRQLCLNCGCGEEYSALFEVWIHPTKTARTGVTSLKAVGSSPLVKDLPFAFIKLPERHIPVCSECIETFEPQGASAPIPQASREAWAETLRKKYTPEPTQTATKSSTPEAKLEAL